MNYIYIYSFNVESTIIHTKDPSTIDESEGSDRSCFRDNETKTKKQRQKKQGNDCFGRSSHSHKFGTVGVSFMKKLLSL